MEVLPNLRKPQDRRADAAGQEIERHQFAHRQVAFNDKFCAEKKNTGNDQLAHKLGGLTGVIAEAKGSWGNYRIGITGEGIPTVTRGV